MREQSEAFEAQTKAAAEGPVKRGWVRWLRPLEIAGIGALLLAGLSSSASASQGQGAGGGQTWRERWAVLEPHAVALEVESGWTGLARFLEVVAFMESRGQLDSVHDGGIGRGPFALHATSSAVQAIGGLEALPLLSDPRVAVATAATHAARLLLDSSRDFPRADTRWGDVRAGWAIPTWAGSRNVQDTHGKSRAEVVARFAQRAAQLGYPELATASAAPSGKWPGLLWALTTLGSPLASKVNPNAPAA